MRKWLAATMVACLLLPAVDALAQLPRPSAVRIKSIPWRVSLAAVAGGYVDSTSKTLTGAAAVDTTAPISTQDFAYPTWMTASTSVGPGPRFFLTTPNTSTADTIYWTVQGSFDGSHWLTAALGQWNVGVAGTTSTAFSTMPIAFGGSQMNAKASTQQLLPVPYMRLIAQGSGTQAFSAAKLSMAYLSAQDATGYGLPYGRWKLYDDPSYPLKWHIGPADSVAHNLAAADADTTTTVYLGDVDWSPSLAITAAQGFMKLSLWTDKTTAGTDTVYVSMEVSNDNVHWTKSGNTFAAAADHVETAGTTDQWIDIPCIGATLASNPSANNSVYLAPYARWILRMGAGDTMPQMRLALQYQTRSASD